MTYQFLETEAVKLWNLLGFGPTRMAEMRCIDMMPGTPKDKKCRSRVTTTGLQPFLQWCREWNGKGNCFVGRNARKLDHTSAVQDVTCISLDIDPIREKDVAATPQQTEEAVNAGRKLLAVFQDRVGAHGSLAMSGNGALVLWTSESPISVGADIEGKIGEFQRECAEILSNAEFKGVRVDATQDSARLIKCVGTVSVKGGIRITRFLHVASGRGSGDGLFNYVSSLAPQRVPQSSSPLLDKPVDNSRSGADYRLAFQLGKDGATDDEILTALRNNPDGRNDRPDDHKRILEKVRRIFPLKGTAAASSHDVDVSDIVIYSPQSSMNLYRESLRRRHEHPNPELPTGFASLDDATHGLRRGEIYTVAARPGTGKTSFLLNVANHLLGMGKSVLLLSTEMSFYQMWDRLTAIGCEVPSNLLHSGKLAAEQRKQLDSFYERFVEYKFKVSDLFQPDIRQVAKIASIHKPDVLMFDHIQHVGDDFRTLAEFTRGLKALAMQSQCAVMAASQLKRPMQVMDFKTKDVHVAPPRLADLKGCGTIEEESAFVLLMHMSKHSVDEGVPIVEAELAKNRFGPHVSEEFEFHMSYSKFRSAKEA